MRPLVLLMLATIPVLGQTLAPETPGRTPTVAELQRQVATLQSENDFLRREIKALRQALSLDDPAPAAQPEVNRGTKDSAIVVPPTTTRSSQEAGYWLTSSTGKRHNPRCRYYGSSKGHPCKSSEGTACKVCGG